MIQPGRLDTIVEFQRVTTTQNAYGEPTEIWTKIANSPTRADYIPLRGSESVETQKRTAKTVFKLRVRRFGLTPADRLVMNSIEHDIVSIEDNKRHGRDMVVWCEVKI